MVGPFCEVKSEENGGEGDLLLMPPQDWSEECRATSALVPCLGKDLKDGMSRLPSLGRLGREWSARLANDDGVDGWRGRLAEWEELKAGGPNSSGVDVCPGEDGYVGVTLREPGTGDADPGPKLAGRRGRVGGKAIAVGDGVEVSFGG